GWTRADGLDRVFLVNRSQFTPIRENGRERSRQFDEFLRRRWLGQRDLMAPLFAMTKGLHTGPLVRGAAGDWDDVMIDRLIDASRPLSITSEGDQWRII